MERTAPPARRHAPTDRRDAAAPQRRLAGVLALALLGLAGGPSGCREDLADSVVPDSDAGRVADAGSPGDGAFDGGEPGDGASDPLRFGAADTFELVTWNIHNFPGSLGTIEAVTELVRTFDADVVAFQEIADVVAFETLVTRVADWDGVVSPDSYGDGYQKTGLLVRRGMVRVLASGSILTDDGSAFPRPPFEVRLEVTRPGEAVQALTVIVVHLKAYTGEDNEARRRSACAQLQRYVEEQQAITPGARVVTLGDFNDSPADPPEDNVFTAFLEAPERYRLATAELVADGQFSYIPFHSFIDHIILTRTTEAAFGAWQARVLPVELLRPALSYRNRVSDHRPVAVVFE